LQESFGMILLSIVGGQRARAGLDRDDQALYRHRIDVIRAGQSSS